MKVKLSPAQVEKSYVYRGPLHVTTFGEDKKTALGQGYKLSGFDLEKINLGSISPKQIYLKLSPGEFSSNGIAVKVNSPIEIYIPPFLRGSTSPRGVAVYAYTLSSINTEDTYIEYGFPDQIRPHHALLGFLFYPAPGTSDALKNEDARTDDDFPMWMPVQGGKLSNLANPGSSFQASSEMTFVDWTGSAVSSAANVTLTHSGALDSVTIGYELNSSIPIGVNSLLFASGKLMVEGADYHLDGPGRAIVWSKDYSGNLQPYFTGSWGVEAIDISSGSFDTIHSDDITFRIDQPFDGMADSIISIPDNANRTARESSGILVFGNGFLLGPDRYKWEKDKGYIRVNKSNSIYGTDESVSVAIEYVSVVGFRNMAGVDLVTYESSPKAYAPGNASYQTYSRTVNVSTGDANSLQVWVDGRLCFADHIGANSDTDAFARGLTGSNTIQKYVSMYGVDSFELGVQPFGVMRSSDSLQRLGQPENAAFTTLYAKRVVAARFNTAKSHSEYYPLIIRPDSFDALDEASNPNLAGITDSIFNFVGGAPTYPGSYWGSLSSPRHWDVISNDSEFYDSSGFNQNYFLTIDSFMGYHKTQSSDHIYPGYNSYDPRMPDKRRSVFGVMRMSIDLLSDIPEGTGTSIEAADELVQDSTGILPGAQIRGNRGAKLTDDYGLYRTTPDVDGLFSDENPIVTYAGLDAFLSRWMDSFGAILENSGGSKEYLREMGIDYETLLGELTGNIQSAFGGLLRDNGAALANSGIETSDTLVEVMEKLMDIESSQRQAFGWGFGYMWTNRFFDMESGTFHHISYNKNRYPSGPFWNKSGQRFYEFRLDPGEWKYNQKRTVPGLWSEWGPFKHGMYLGHIDFLRPDEIVDGPLFDLTASITFQSSYWGGTGTPNSHADPKGLIVMPEDGNNGLPLKGGNNNWDNVEGVYGSNKSAVHNYMCNLGPIRRIYGSKPETETYDRNSIFHNTDHYINWCKLRDDDGISNEAAAKLAHNFTYITPEGQTRDKFGFRILGNYKCWEEPVSFFLFGPTRHRKPKYLSGNSSENYFVIS